ncbi:phytanoyl-CoA dioxygenase family protein [Streptomyces sp. SID3343]|uniref:phytanoyl-CoA dioxygenase family protein n=1 Tax=Streptomyces sp. SID3343 TaxID=2690260 RepID=UPI00136DEA9D|nr:phytanoyl-CoA dioxygenase family protein [Streptomyces sp. SID3343]MYW00125.1 mitomycin antibiotic biosynthesis protein [Streptomyces sp. SID3343]
MTDLARLHSGTPTAQIVAAMERDGAVIVTDFLAPDVLERFNRELDPLLGDARPGHGGEFVNDLVAAFFGDHVRHVAGLAGKSSTFVDEVLVHPVYEGVNRAVLGASCEQHILNIGHVMDRGPGAQRQYLHRDQLVWHHVPASAGQIQVSSVVALNDFTADNGATVVAPGSHQWPWERRPLESELAVAEMPAGSAVLYLGSTIHAGGTNSTRDTWRRGIHISYCAGWLRTEENQYLVVGPDRVRTMSTHARTLLGYTAHDGTATGGGYLGTVELAGPERLLDTGGL